MDRSYKDFLADMADRRRISDETETAYFTILKKKNLPDNIKRELKRRIADNHIPFVISVANKFSSKNATRCDLINIGMTGLMRAIDSFSVDSGYRFISYAVWWIRQAIYKYVFNDDNLIHIPQNEKIRIKRLLKESEKTGVPLSQMNLTKKELENINLAQSAMAIYSLDLPVVHSNYMDGSDLTYAEVIPGVNLYTQKEEEEFNKNVKSILDLVSGSDRDVLAKSFGIGEHQHSFREIGEAYGRSGERIRQYRNRALRRLTSAAKKTDLYREMAGLPRLKSTEAEST
jgi:RNA polymerase primary sigma factor